MRPNIASLTAAAVLAWAPVAAAAQATGSAVPDVAFRFEPAYESVLLGGSGDPAGDARWAESRSEPLTDFYARDGARLLAALSDYAGVPWPYGDVSVYLVRRLPTLSIQYPLTIAVGEIRQGEARQEVPEGDFLVLTFAHQIAHHLLDPPPTGAGATSRPEALDHPLMEEGSHRREALVNVVVYRALEDLWGAERLRDVVETPLWASYNPQAEFVERLRGRWSLSRSRPLVTWLLQEPEDGVLASEAARLEESGGPASAPRGGAPAGVAGTEVGLDLGQSAEGRLFVAFLDPGSPADAAGLRPGDVVLTIEGRRFTDPGAAMDVVRDAWERSREVNLSVERQGREVFFQIH